MTTRLRLSPDSLAAFESTRSSAGGTPRMVIGFMCIILRRVSDA